jgi:hypothetical protein
VRALLVTFQLRNIEIRTGHAGIVIIHEYETYDRCNWSLALLHISNDHDVFLLMWRTQMSIDMTNKVSDLKHSRVGCLSEIVAVRKCGGRSTFHTRCDHHEYGLK